MVEERSQQLLVCAGLVEGVDDFIGESAEVIRDVVGQVGVLRMRPDLLHRIEFGRVGWKPLHLNLVTESMQEPPYARPVNRPPVHHEDDVATDPTPHKISHEALPCRSPEVEPGVVDDQFDTDPTANAIEGPNPRGQGPQPTSKARLVTEEPLDEALAARLAALVETYERR